jgi:polysaccharide export outer membrane protein
MGNRGHRTVALVRGGEIEEAIMIVKRCLILVLAVLLSGCAAKGATPIEASNVAGEEMVKNDEASAAGTVYRFYPGDELSITAVNRPELSVSAKVDPYGFIAYPYLGQVNVKNLSAYEVAARLSGALQEQGYYNRTQISVAYVSSKEQFVYVLGEVKKPGEIPISGSIPLLVAIGKAGGQTYDAEMSTVLWIRGRQSPPGVVKLDLEQLGNPRSSKPVLPNLVLSPGDVIFIPDSVIASVERFMGRIMNILQPIVELERGIVLYPDVEAVLRSGSRGGGSQTINIVVP